MRFGVAVNEPAGFYLLAPATDGMVIPQLTTIEEDACSFSSIFAAIHFAQAVKAQLGYATKVYVTNE